MKPYNLVGPQRKPVRTADELAEDPHLVAMLQDTAARGGGAVFLTNAIPEAEIERVGYSAIWEAMRRRLPAGWTLSDSLTGAGYYKSLNLPDSTEGS